MGGYFISFADIAIMLYINNIEHKVKVCVSFCFHFGNFFSKTVVIYKYILHLNKRQT